MSFARLRYQVSREVDKLADPPVEWLDSWYQEPLSVSVQVPLLFLFLFLSNVPSPFQNPARFDLKVDDIRRLLKVSLDDREVVNAPAPLTSSTFKPAKTTTAKPSAKTPVSKPGPRFKVPPASTADVPPATSSAPNKVKPRPRAKKVKVKVELPSKERAASPPGSFISFLSCSLPDSIYIYI